MTYFHVRCSQKTVNRLRMLILAIQLFQKKRVQNQNNAKLLSFYLKLKIYFSMYVLELIYIKTYFNENVLKT